MSTQRLPSRDAKPRGIAHAQLFHAHVHGEGWSQTDFSHAHALAGKNAPFPTKYGETREGLGSEVWFCGKTNLYIHTTYKLVCIVETTHKRVSRACWLSFFWLNRSTVLLRQNIIMNSTKVQNPRRNSVQARSAVRSYTAHARTMLQWPISLVLCWCAPVASLSSNT